MLVASTGEQGISQAAIGAPDIIVLDLGLPDLDGMEVCRQDPTMERRAHHRALGRRHRGPQDRLARRRGRRLHDQALRDGRARGAASEWRSGTAPPEPGDEEAKDIVVGALELDLVHHEARMEGRPIELTTREFSLLVFLARHAGKICTHRMILEHVWGPHYGTETQYLRVYVYRLRRKLGDEKGELLRTNPGVGYQLVDEETAVAGSVTIEDTRRHDVDELASGSTGPEGGRHDSKALR